MRDSGLVHDSPSWTSWQQLASSTLERGGYVPAAGAAGRLDREWSDDPPDPEACPHPRRPLAGRPDRRLPRRPGASPARFESIVALYNRLVVEYEPQDRPRR